MSVATNEDLPHAWKRVDNSRYSAYVVKESNVVLVLQHSPFRVELFQNGNQVIVLNNRDMMHFEQSMESGNDKEVILDSIEQEDRHQGKEVVDYGEDGKST